jgi:hypothetical protein
MWQLRFFVEPQHQRGHGRRSGSWYVSLSLMEHSPPTWIDSRLLIAEPQTQIPKGDKSSKSKPNIIMRLSSTSTLTPPSQHGGEGVTEVVVNFEDIAMATSLQYRFVQINGKEIPCANCLIAKVPILALMKN